MSKQTKAQRNQQALEYILSKLTGINYDDLSRSEKDILVILYKNGVLWHKNKYGDVTKGLLSVMDELAQQQENQK